VRVRRRDKEIDPRNGRIGILTVSLRPPTSLLQDRGYDTD
jgi:hypothetical protein